MLMAERSSRARRSFNDVLALSKKFYIRCIGIVEIVHGVLVLGAAAVLAATLWIGISWTGERERPGQRHDDAHKM